MDDDPLDDEDPVYRPTRDALLDTWGYTPLVDYFVELVEDLRGIIIRERNLQAATRQQYLNTNVRLSNDLLNCHLILQRIPGAFQLIDPTWQDPPLIETNPPRGRYNRNVV